MQEGPIRPDALKNITQEQIIVINKLIKQTWIMSLGLATFTCERLAKELGIPSSEIIHFIRDVQKVYSIVGWRVEIDENMSIDSYIAFIK